MKLVFFNDFTLGVLKNGNVVDVSEAVRDVPHVTPQDLMSGVIAGFASLRSRIEEVADKSAGVPVDQVRLRPPLPKPTHMVAMAANYLEFGARRENPPTINAFLKASSSVIGPGDTIVLPPAKADVFHHEAELGVVIGKEAAHVKEADAYDYIFGYVNFIDACARGLGRGSFYWGKSWDTFGPMGPCIVTADEVPDPMNLVVQLRVNGKIRHLYPTLDMAYDIPRCLEWSSGIVSLEPGDIIAMGTNHQGIGAIQDGDLIEMEIEGLEKLVVHVKDDLKREWPRSVDHAFADRVAGRTPR
ncbi:MAG: fumarylacetoacetate hydrolase family protein [Dehalococcoidia bacterium]